MKALHLEFKSATGKMPIIELDTEEYDDIIPDHYLVPKKELDSFDAFDNWNNTLSCARNDYVEFLESKINELQSQLSSIQKSETSIAK